MRSGLIVLALLCALLAGCTQPTGGTGGAEKGTTSKDTPKPTNSVKPPNPDPG